MERPTTPHPHPAYLGTIQFGCFPGSPLHKLHFYSIRGNILDWIKDFLDNRTQSVILNGGNSHNIALSSGVPQGSALEPILFLAYINDLLEQVRSRVRLFADDTAMYLALDNQADIEILQKYLENLENWEKLWDMSFNPFKCQVVHVTRLKTPLQTKYHLHGCVHESVPSAKYLGSLYQKTSNGPNTSTTLPKRQIKH